MQNLDQSAVNGPAQRYELARRYEALALRTWPGKELLAFQGWTLRFAQGKGHRPNSVATTAFSGDLAAAVEMVERSYEARGLPPMFHIHPASEPSGLADFLLARGYRPEPASLVYAGKTADAAAFGTGGVIRHDVPEDFARLVRAGSTSPEDGEERLGVVARLAVPNASLVAFHEGTGRACGHIGAADGVAAINLVRTEPGFRRLGLARQILGALARWALVQDCPALTLCVDEKNAPARSLYERAGFEPLYRYFYLIKDKPA